jgi:hypothetical protein
MIGKLSPGAVFLHFGRPKPQLVAIRWRHQGAMDKVSTSELNNESRPSKANPPKGSKMNILKNFEALFVVTLGLACAANYVMDDSAATQAENQVVAQAAAPAAQQMQVIVVSAKRLSAEQKQQSLIAERKASSSADGAASSTI